MEYLLERPDFVFDAVIEHLYITVVSVLGTLVIGVLLGVLITRFRALYDPILTVAGVIYTVPSLAMFVLLIPILGIGFKSAVVALILYSLLIIVRNTAVGIDSVDPNILEAARGMGMTKLGILARVELPLAIPVIFAGIRIATVSAISIATIAAFIGAGGIGTLLFEGLSSQRNDKIVAGALAASVMAISAEVILRQIEQGLSPGLSGDFKTIGERLINLKPDWIVVLGALIVLFSFTSMSWVEPYAQSERLLEDNEAQAALEAADYSLEKTGLDLARLGSDVPVETSLQFLPLFALIALLAAAYNLWRYPGNRALTDVYLLCVIIAAFALGHFYYETQRAIGELGSFSSMFRSIRGEISDISGARLSPRLETLDIQTGYYVTVAGVALILLGSFLKSYWYHQQRQEDA